MFNLLRMGDMEVGENDRPLDAPILETIKVLDNPFEDMVARSTVAKQGRQVVMQYPRFRILVARSLTCARGCAHTNIFLRLIISNEWAGRV